MQRAILSTIFLAASATAAVAGPYEAPPAPPPVIIDESCTLAFECFYLGLEYGFGTGEADFTVPGAANFDTDAEGTLWGGFAGYNVRNGQMIYGGEVRILHLIDSDNDDFQLADVVDIRARVGFVVSEAAMVYGAAGYSTGTAEVLGTEVDADGFNLGAGAEFNVTDSIFLGLDVTHRNLDGEVFMTDFETEATTATVRIGFRF